LTLPPFGSAFVVFDPGIRAPGAAARGALPPPVEIDGPWDLQLNQDGRAVPVGSLPRLISWTKHPETDVKYFSGIATYSKTIRISGNLLNKDLRLYLDLGEVRVIARVRLNGADAGICWTRPFRVDITSHAVEGANRLEIEVANTWSNRITGDAMQQRPKRTNARWSAATPLLTSGLMGPVRLVLAHGAGFS
jgi:hypothetical protein